MANPELGTQEELDNLKKTISELEEETDAEIVPVLAPRSSRYPEACARGGILVSLIFLGLLVFLPVTFPAYAILPDALIGYLAGYYLVRWSPTLQRLLTFTSERDRAVYRQSGLAYLEEELTGTERRTGMLIFYSALENLGTIRMDYKLQNVIPDEELANWKKQLQNRDPGESGASRIQKVLNPAGELLKKKLPPVGEKDNEHPDQPVIRKL